MTIDSGWVRVMKEEVPEAFRSSYPFKGGSPKVAYIDGMPLLMISERNVQCWDDLLRNNFARHIQRYFRLGCRAVVLAFDDYDRVPMSKAITQANRSKKKAPYEFGEGQQLPPTIPHGFNEKLSNRIFKRRVIDMVCNRVASHVALSGTDAYTRRLVVDYTGCPILFEAPGKALHFDAGSAGGKLKFMVDVPPMGEADIKFLRWADYFGGDLVAASVDGDFIPIALMRHEERVFENKVYSQQVRRRQQQQQQGEGRRGDERGEEQGGEEDELKKPLPVRNVCIFRLKYRSPDESRKRREAESRASHHHQQQQQQQMATLQASKKQRCIVAIPARGGKTKLGLSALPDAGDGEASSAAAAAACAQSQQQQQQQHSNAHQPREYEYVDIPRLYEGLRAAMHSMGGGSSSSSSSSAVKRNPVHPYHYMRMLAVLIGLGGTDFSRGLPFVGPATLWAMVRDSPAVFSALLQSYDLSNGLMLPGTASNSLACHIYMQKFASHFAKAARAGASSLCVALDSDSDGEDGEGGGSELESCPRRFEAVRRALQRSSLGEKTRADLPSALRVSVTFRNINWLLQYWACVPPTRGKRPSAAAAASEEGGGGDEDGGGAWDYAGCYPDPISDRYGFRMGGANNAEGGKNKNKNKKAAAKKRKAGSASAGCVQWLDEAEDDDKVEGVEEDDEEEEDRNGEI